MNLLRSPEDAYDVYQEAFLRVYRNLDSFRFDCSFHTWLYRIVTNLCLDHLRKRKVRRTESAVVDTGDGPVDRLESFPESRAHGDPQRQLLSRELQGKILQQRRQSAFAVQRGGVVVGRGGGALTFG